MRRTFDCPERKSLERTIGQAGRSRSSKEEGWWESKEERSLVGWNAGVWSGDEMEMKKKRKRDRQTNRQE